ncbi:hypothetical protein ID866_11494 [Astraeus odoratus]|nr:hypothetical protein ID866_11494 [Astraeus odoratus]
MVTLTHCQAALESLASTHCSSEAGEPFISFSAHCTTPKPPLPSASAVSFPPSTPHPRNPSDNDLGNDDDENPFDDNNSNNNDDYKDANDSTQEDWAVQVFESLTHAIDSLACTSRKSGSSSSQTKVHEPDTFNGTDSKKLCTFLVQCKLNFQDCPSAFKKDCAKVVFTQSYLKGMALKWFEPDLLSSSNPRSHPLWMYDCPHNPVTNAENQLDHLQMKENQCINNDGALHHQFYSGLPNHIKDKICHVGKPHNLDDLHYLAQEIDTHYWEHKEEVQRTNKSSGTNNFPANKPGSSASNSSSSLGNTNSSSPNQSKSSNGGNKSSNATSSNPDITGKLGKDSKLTPEERKRHLDNKLCMFCGDNGHFSDNCPKKANKGKAKACATNATQSLQEQSGSTSGFAPEAKK